MATEFENINIGAFVGDQASDGFRSGGIKINANFDKVQVKTKVIPVTVTAADDLTAIADKINLLANVPVGPDESVRFVCSTVPGAALPRYTVLEPVNLGKGSYGVGGFHLAAENLTVISDRLTETPVINQDNKGRNVNLTTISVSATPLTDAAVAQLLNNTTRTITEVQTPVLVWVTTGGGAGPDELYIPPVKHLYLFLAGKGVYGPGGTTVTAAMVKYIATYNPTPEDIENAGNTTTIDLGTLPGEDYVTAANSEARDLSDTETNYFFKYTVDGAAYVLLAFVGVPGLYGVGGTVLTEADFQQAASDDAPPGQILTLEDVALNGNSTTQELISSNGADSAGLSPEGILNFKNSGKKLSIKPTVITDDKLYTIDGSKPNGDSFAMATDVNGLTLTSNPAAQEIYLKNLSGTTLATLNVAFLNNEGTMFYYNNVTGNLELKNDAGVVLSTIPVSAFVTNIVHSAAFNVATPANLEFKDTTGAVLFTVPFAINNISGLQSALDAKVTGTQAADGDIQTETLPNISTAGKYVDSYRLVRWWVSYIKPIINSLLSFKVGQYNTEISAVASGTNTYAATITPAITAYVDGAAYMIKFTNANTAAATLNLNSLGAKNITVGGAALPSGFIDANIPYMMLYNATTNSFRLTTSNKVATQTYGDNSKNIANTEFVQGAVAALSSNFLFNNVDSVPSASLTGTTTATILKTIPIPAGTFKNGSASLRISGGGTGTAGAKIFFIFYSYNATSISGGVQLGRLNMTTPQISAPMWRDYSISNITDASDTTATIKGYPFDANAPIPSGSTLPLGSAVINPVPQGYFHVVGQLENVSDTMFVDYIETIIKRSN